MKTVSLIITFLFLITFPAEANPPVNTFTINCSFSQSVDKELTQGEITTENISLIQFDMTLKGEMYRSGLLVKSITWKASQTKKEKTLSGNGTYDKDILVKLTPRKSVAVYAEGAEFTGLIKKLKKEIKKKSKIKLLFKDKYLAALFNPLVNYAPTLEMAQNMLNDKTIALDSEKKSNKRKLVLKGSGDDDRGILQYKNAQNDDGMAQPTIRLNYLHIVPGTEKTKPIRTETTFNAQMSVKLAKVDMSAIQPPK